MLQEGINKTQKENLKLHSVNPFFVKTEKGGRERKEEGRKENILLYMNITKSGRVLKLVTKFTLGKWMGRDTSSFSVYISGVFFPPITSTYYS